jgi:hypothetical protein
MSQDNNEEREGMVRIPLDGTYGAGPESEITIIVKTPDGQLRETTYLVPYYCLNMRAIQAMNDINFIMGYKIVKGEGAVNTGLKALGL